MNTDHPKIVAFRRPKVRIETCMDLVKGGTRRILLDDFVLAEVHYDYQYIDNAGQHRIVNAILDAIGVDPTRLGERDDG